MKSKTFWSEADMLPLERVMGKPEALMSNQTGIGVAVELRCPHCGSQLELMPDDQPYLQISHLQCKLGHVLVLTVLNENGRCLLYFATPRDPGAHTCPPEDMLRN